MLKMLEKAISSSGEQPLNTDLEEQCCLNSLLKTHQRAFSISGFNFSCLTTALSTACQFFEATFLTVGYTSDALFFHWATVSALSHGWWYRYCLEENLHFRGSLRRAVLGEAQQFPGFAFPEKKYQDIESTIPRLIERFSGNHFMALLQTMWDSWWVILI